MSEEVKTDQVSESTTSAPVADNQQEQQKPAETVEDLRALLDKERKERQNANKEAQTIRTRLRELEAADEERKKAAMTEQERIAAELESTRKALESEKARMKATMTAHAVTIAAQQQGVHDVEAAMKLLDHDKIEYDDAGAPKNVDALVTELVKAKPYLVLAAGAGATNAIRGAGATVGREQELRSLLYGQPVNVFDPKFIEAAGGGLRMSPKHTE